MRRTQLLIAVLSISGLITACAVRRNVRDTSTPAVPPEPGTWIDLQPGWRLSVVTPLLRSGNHILPQAPAKTSAQGTSLNVTMSTGPDFLGYERSYYAVEPRRGGGVRVRFISAESFKEGKLHTEKRSVIRLFDLPRNARHVRLVYLVRASKADHNMAVIAVPEVSALNGATRQVQALPAGGCRTPVCQWIPAGIAVRPERQREGSTEWRPAH